MHRAVYIALAGLVIASVTAGAQDTTRAPTPPDTVRADTAQAPPAQDSVRAGQAADTTVRVRNLSAEDTLAAARRVSDDPLHRFSVTPVVGTINWDNTSALANKTVEGGSGAFTKRVYTPSFGLSANFNVLRQLGIGAYFEAARPETRGDYFPAAYFKYGQDVQLTTVSQRVTVMMYGVQGQFQFPISKLEPYVSGGFGGVTVNTDPQQNNENRQISNKSAQFGGGIGYHIGAGAIVLDVRNFMFFNWDRDRLYPVSPTYQNTTVPVANLAPPAEKSTINNFRIALGFSYVPRFSPGTTAEGEDESDDQ